MKIQHLLTHPVLTTATLATALLTCSVSFADGSHTSGIHSKLSTSQNIEPTFDIVHTKVTTKNNIATFHMAVASQAGTSKPSASGKLAGSSVYSYVWPTSLDSASVGFESNAGILALAVTAHPDFDDTPLYDENADNDPGNDGDIWHSHWVVLQPNEQCGKGALGVVDIPEGATPKLPKTWPGLPILLDSPGWDPVFNGDTVEVNVAFDDITVFEKTSFDGVTAGLRVNQSVHAPLLCVVNVIDIASGDLSLPGKANQ
ncbi:hypothetical protein [Neptunomonas japonica]|uniref:hypothetical protein n=1 Tax=Neptunomonas japonica TaxID=417574 RepID=UPI0003F93030|nr:hypothetical protein [Neptunomonas japonica]